MSMGRSRTVRTPHVPILTPSFFIKATRAAESFVSKEMYVLESPVSARRFPNAAIRGYLPAPFASEVLDVLGIFPGELLEFGE